MNPAGESYRVCSRCVMDTTDPGISFDAEGVCNHCRYFENDVRRQLPSPEEAAERFQNIVADIKRSGVGREYDCLLGISGGVDSSYLAYLAWKHGLRTLLVHMDNGWDSELAIKNIENIVKTTGFDYYNHVVDWEEFKDLQLAYFRASVVDIEVVTDHAITAFVYRTAWKFGIKYILDGNNEVTEAIYPRRGWMFLTKSDLANLMAIHRKFGHVPLKTYPRLALYEIKFYRQLRDLRFMSLLNLVPYRLEDAMKVLEREFGWRYYGGKHWESAFTKFYQAYILPRKFNVDKRKVHLSNLICSGQITRQEALQKLKTDVYSPEQLREEYEYVVKKLGLTRDEFERIMALPVVPHEAYPTEATQLSYRLRAAFWGAAGEGALFARRNWWRLRRVWRRIASAGASNPKATVR
ncbi:MAG: N-acetyl sugar amidotransferase [Verrucomicrobia bacterium]|nr:N-acetyl sugar amidotransferase [Verrucomicrobiota bacterium]